MSEKTITAGVSCDDVYLRYVFLLIAYDGAGYSQSVSLKLFIHVFTIFLYGGSLAPHYMCEVQAKSIRTNTRKNNRYRMKTK